MERAMETKKHWHVSDRAHMKNMLSSARVTDETFHQENDDGTFRTSRFTGKVRCGWCWMIPLSTLLLVVVWCLSLLLLVWLLFFVGVGVVASAGCGCFLIIFNRWMMENNSMLGARAMQITTHGLSQGRIRAARWSTTTSTPLGRAKLLPLTAPPLA